MEEFNSCCLEADLEDIRIAGILYTWLNCCPSNMILRRLNRALVDQRWLQHCPALEAFIPSPGILDHSPIVVCLNLDASLRKSFFKFFNVWASHPGFLSIVQRVWNTLVVGIPMFQVVTKLQVTQERAEIFKSSCHLQYPTAS